MLQGGRVELLGLLLLGSVGGWGWGEELEGLDLREGDDAVGAGRGGEGGGCDICSGGGGCGGGGVEDEERCERVRCVEGAFDRGGRGGDLDAVTCVLDGAARSGLREWKSLPCTNSTAQRVVDADQRIARCRTCACAAGAIAALR